MLLIIADVSYSIYKAHYVSIYMLVQFAFLCFRRESTRSKNRVDSVEEARQADILSLRCTQCNQPLQFYDEETLNMAMVCLATYIQREPALAAETLPHALQTVARLVIDLITH